MLRIVLARWESQRGKDWIEVYENPGLGCGYQGRGCGGWMGNVTREEAVADIQRRVDQGCFCSQKTPMRKVA
jgi:hypothetical protein